MTRKLNRVLIGFGIAGASLFQGSCNIVNDLVEQGLGELEHSLQEEYGGWNEADGSDYGDFEDCFWEECDEAMF